MKPLYAQYKEQNKIVDVLFDGPVAGTGESIGLSKKGTDYLFLVLISENNRASMLYPILNMESSCSLGIFWLFNEGHTLTLTNPTQKIKRVLGVK